VDIIWFIKDCVSKFPLVHLALLGLLQVLYALCIIQPCVRCLANKRTFIANLNRAMDIRRYDIDSFVKQGAYSHAVQAGQFIFVSGMLPIDYASGLRVTDDVGRATEVALNNVSSILAAAGSSLEKIVKVTVFLRDIADFARMNEVYTRFFTSNPPARTCVAVKDIPGNFPLEIEVIASK